jgi:DNA-directed RNA polymerase specialized sigma24 family protein
MAESRETPRLDMISTRWTLLNRAFQGGGDAAAAAQAAILERYGGAVQRYLRGALKDADAADDLFQEFAYRFLHGDLRGACPEKGRFRDYLKAVISHQVADHFKRRQRQHPVLPEKFPEPAAPAESDLDRLFQESWREQLLAKTWEALAELERTTGQPFFTVLRFRADNPELRSPDMAARLEEILKKPLTSAGVRQLLHRAREKFAELLQQIVTASLDSDDPEQVDQELEELGLLVYVRPVH